MNWSKQPLIFDHNRITRSYIGGKLLNEWRRMEKVEDSHHCEELLVTSIGAISDEKPEGYAISKTVDGTSLQDIINENPNGVLGNKYHEINPNNLSVLARAGDTIVRLVMQCHPKQEDALKFFNENQGKAEAWYITRTREVGEDNCVYAGFKKHVTKELWKTLIQQQDISGMLYCLHKHLIKEGDVVLIPAGMPHAVGPGCIFTEIHECSDITIRVEKNVNGVILSEEEMFNGLTEDTALELFDYTTYTIDEIAKVCIMKERNERIFGESKIVTVIDLENTDAFRMELLYIKDKIPLDSFDGHRVLIPVENSVCIISNGKEYEVSQGWGCLLPAEIGNIIIKSNNTNFSKVVMGYPRKV